MISKEYRSVIKTMHDSGNWGATGHRHAGALFLERLLEWPDVKTVLDFGCGKGTMKQYLEQRHPHITVTEYDPCIPGKDKLPKRQFDAVLSSDVLEHIEPDRLTETLQWLASATSVFMMHDIACHPTGSVFTEGPYKGQDHHLTIETPTWWRERIANDVELQELEYMHRERASFKGQKTRCFLLHERI